MVVKLASSNRENFGENSENEESGKSSKRELRSPSRLTRKVQQGLGYSPSKVPLSSSSLTNISNSSPLKYQQIILPKTPIKQEHNLGYSSGSSPDQGSSFVSPFHIKYEGDLIETPPSVPPSGYSPERNTSVSKNLNEALGNLPRAIEPLDRSILPGSCTKRLSINRTNKNNTPHPAAPPVSRRNARERNRVKQVSMGFAILRQHVPQANRKKKLSKVETLRCAVEYIRGLQALLQQPPQPVSKSYSGSQAKNLLTSYHPENSSGHFQQIPTQHQTTQSDLSGYCLQKAPTQITFQNGGGSTILLPSNALYEDRIQHLQVHNSSLEPKMLKVSKMEDTYQSTDDSASIFCSLPSIGYVKYPTSGNINSLSNVEYVTPGGVQESKEHHTVITHSQEFSQANHISAKDSGDMDLLDALAWWQHNS